MVGCPGHLREWEDMSKDVTCDSVGATDVEEVSFPCLNVTMDHWPDGRAPHVGGLQHHLSAPKLAELYVAHWLP